MGTEAESIPISLQAIDGKSESSVLLAVLNTRILDLLGDVADDTKGLIDILSAQYQKVLERHRQLPGKLHTLEHHFDVHGRLTYLFSHLNYPGSISHRMKIFMLEAAFRHDDGHIGNKHRQNKTNGDQRSNEEFAVDLLRSDQVEGIWNGQFADEIRIISKLILSTSSHQRPPAVEGDSPLYRPYEAQTIEEKLLVFADVSGCLLSGWDYWMTESDNFYDEEGISKVRDAVWVKSRQDFLQFVWKLYTDNIQDLLDPEAQKMITENHQIDIWNQKKIEDQIHANTTSPYSS